MKDNVNSPMQNSLSVKVLKRFLSEEELDRIIINYHGHKLAKGTANRLYTYSIPVSADDLSMLKDYVLTNEPIRELAARYKLSASGLVTKAKSIAFRLLSQNPEFLKGLK